jgi:LPS export ABC transporter permease LptG
MASVAASTAAGPRRRHRPGLIDLYLVRGVAGTFLLVTLFLMAGMMLERALRLIHELAASGADVGYLPALLAHLAPYYLGLASPAAFMVALVLAVARFDERLELEAMLASGLSLSRIAAPLVALGILIGLIGLVAGGWLEPIGRYGFRAERLEALNAGRIARLEPRALYHPAESLAVTFDSRGPDGRVEGIFVWQRLGDGSELVLTSPSGRLGFVPERRAFGIDLVQGLYVAEPPPAARRAPYLLAFDALAFRESLRLEDTSWRRGWDQKEMTIPELIAARRTGASRASDHALAAELYSRLARAATIPLIPLLVLPLAFAAKRGRRGLGILAAGILLTALHHGLNMMTQLGYKGAVAPGLGITGAAALFAAIVVGLFVAGRHLPSHGPVTAIQQRIGATLSGVPRRTRALPNLRGRTIATYLAWQLAKWSSLALLAIVVLLQMVDLFDRGEPFVERGMGAADMLYYLLLRLAPTVQQAIPIAALAGAMITFADLGRSREMAAIRAAGISQWRILMMALPVPLVLAGAAFLLSEYATPRSQLRFAAWWAATEPARDGAGPQARWFRIGGEIVRAARASPGGTRLEDVDIFRRDGRGRLAERISAEQALSGEAGWALAGVDLTRLASGRLETRRHARMAWPTRLQPEDVAAFFTSTRAMSSAAALRSLEIAAPVSQSEALFTTRLYRLAAEPLAPILMLLLALPLAFVPPRTGLAWPALLYAGAGGLLYLVADGVLTVAAQVGSLPPLVGAWTAPLMAALTGVTVLLYTER